MSDMSGRSPIGTMRVLRLGGTSQILPVPARDPGADGAHPGQGTAAWRRCGVQWVRSSWVDIAWAGFAGLNLAAMRRLPAGQTGPVLAIWVSLTAIYGGAAELGERVQRGGLRRGGVNRAQRFGDGVPVAAAGVAEAVAQQVHVMPTSV